MSQPEHSRVLLGELVCCRLILVQVLKILNDPRSAMQHKIDEITHLITESKIIPE